MHTQYIYFFFYLNCTAKDPRNVPMETAFALLDHFLQPIAQACKSYIKCILATLGLARLYTNISHEDACKAISEALDGHIEPHLPPKHILITLLKFVLQNNVFSFNNRCATTSCTALAMGTKLAPALATIYMAQIEEHFLARTLHKPHTWVR